jgi:hypothetical protein
MGLINYKDIDFNKSIDKTNKVINFNGSEIQIVNYLSTQDKYDFIMITLQKSFSDGIYHDLKLNMYFDLHLIYMYTNIMFDAEDKADEVGLYDTLNRSGLIKCVKENIDAHELTYLYDLLNRTEKKMKDYKGSLLNFLTEMTNNFPQKAQQAIDTLRQIDPELLKQLNGGSLSFLNGLLLKEE